VAAATSLTFVAPRALATGDLANRLELAKPLVAVDDCRSIAKDDLPENTARPDVRVEPDTFAVTVDGELIEAHPVAELPMAQRYFLF
jgi:urease subunit alpha